MRHFPKKYKKLNYKKDIFRPEIARQAGSDYLLILKYYLKSRNIPVTLENLLAAYNWGVANVNKYGVKRAPLQTKRYIKKIKISLD